MTMIKVEKEESGEKLFESQRPLEQHVSRVRRRRPMTLSVRIARRNRTSDAGQDAVVVKLYHEKRLFEVILNEDLQALGVDIIGAIVPIIRKKFPYHLYRAENGDSSESLQPIGGHLSSPHEENRPVRSPLQRKQKTSESISMLYKRQKLTDQKEEEQSFSYAAVEEDAAVTASEDDDSVFSVKEYSDIKIGDKEAVERFYEISFTRIGQANLKGILKAWIKVIHPRKQSTHPYNGGTTAEESKMRFGEHSPGELTKPYYWPGSVKSDGSPKCRHKEPDHLTKNERFILAKHLSWTEGVVIDTLRKSTKALFSPESEAAKLLDEIYTMKEKKEQLFDGEIDADSTVLVEKAETMNKARSSHELDRQKFQGITKLKPESAGGNVRNALPFDFQGSNNMTSSSYDAFDAPKAASILTVSDKRPQTKREAKRRKSNTQIVAAEGGPYMLTQKAFHHTGRGELELSGNNVWDSSYDGDLSSDSPPTRPRLTSSSSVQTKQSSSYGQWPSTRSQYSYIDDVGGQNSGLATPIVSCGPPVSEGPRLEDISGFYGTLVGRQYAMPDDSSARYHQSENLYGLSDAGSGNEALLDNHITPDDGVRYPWRF
ncbi:MAG: hypothetical protein Q9214_000213 [Letrouitia sp. 1 TL-2023]